MQEIDDEVSLPKLVKVVSVPSCEIENPIRFPTMEDARDIDVYLQAR